MEDNKNIRNSFKTKQVRYGGYAVLITLAVVAGLILLNLTFNRLSPRIDLTASGLYSLSDQTAQVLETVKTPVTIYGVWRPGEDSEDIMAVVNLFVTGNSNVRFEEVDPDRNPGRINRFDPDKTGIPRGSLIVHGEKGFRVINPTSMYEYLDPSGGNARTGLSVEMAITRALLFAGTGTTPVIYELTGHGETSLLSAGFQSAVEQENFAVKPLNLLIGEIPPDASAIILNRPTGDFTPAEAGKLLPYLEGGGRFIVIADYNAGELVNLNDVLSSYGIRFDFGRVIEQDMSYYYYDPRTEIPDAGEHDITRPLMDKTRTPMLLMEAASVSVLEERRRDVEVTPLLTSSPDAYLSTSLDEISEETGLYEIPGADSSVVAGPFTLAAAVTYPSYIDPNDKTQPQTRIVAIGCGNLLPIATQLSVPANRDFFLNAVTWVESRPETISLRPKNTYLLPFTLNMTQIIIFAALFIIVIPLAFFITGLVIWLKRRHL